MTLIFALIIFIKIRQLYNDCNESSIMPSTIPRKVKVCKAFLIHNDNIKIRVRIPFSEIMSLRWDHKADSDDDEYLQTLVCFNRSAFSCTCRAKNSQDPGPR